MTDCVCRYKIIGIVYTGTYSTVFCARDQLRGVNVAIKRNDSNSLDSYDQGLSMTMIREAGLLKSLRHENIIELREVLLRESRIFLVSELCYCNLRQHMEQLSLAGTISVDPPRLQSYMIQILSALAFCHEKQIIHRDMKPENVLMDASRRTLKISDFSMARTFITNTPYTERCVTVWYRPPEIILGDSRYGPPVDMWSVGCILAEMITFAPVFRFNTEIECLLHMFRSLGTPDETSWPGVSTLPNFQAFPRWPPQAPAALLNGEGGDAAATAAAAGPHCLALLGRLLQLRPGNRITARKALDHPFF
jgi:cyclin-dependent kinase 2